MSERAAPDDDRNPVELILERMRSDEIKPAFDAGARPTRLFGRSFGGRSTSWDWSYRGYKYSLLRDPDNPILLDLDVRNTDAPHLSNRYPKHVLDLYNYIEDRASLAGRTRDIFNNRRPYANPCDPGRTRPRDNPITASFGVVFYTAMVAALLILASLVASDESSSAMWVFLSLTVIAAILVLASVRRLVACARAIPTPSKKMVKATEWVVRIVNPFIRGG